MFNGSAKDYDKVSINDLLHCGPNLLPDLTELLINWMKYRFVFVSDIEQMFRQILIYEDFLNTETYMDDTLSRGHSLSEALDNQKDLVEICKVGGFSLHKWLANDENLLNFPSSVFASPKSNSCFGLLGLN